MARGQENLMSDRTPALTSTPTEASRAVRLLGERELALLSAAVVDIAPDWSVELCGTDTHDRSLLVMPEGADDMIGPTFMIHAVNGAIRLDQLRFDDIQILAERAHLSEIIHILRVRLASLSLMAVSASTTRH